MEGRTAKSLQHAWAKIKDEASTAGGGAGAAKAVKKPKRGKKGMYNRIFGDHY